MKIKNNQMENNKLSEKIEYIKEVLRKAGKS
jgi:hypothetical protein